MYTPRLSGESTNFIVVLQVGRSQQAIMSKLQLQVALHVYLTGASETLWED